MKRLLLTGGGTGGHIFPLISVADEIRKADFTDIELCYMGPKSPLNGEFSNRDIPVYRIAESKLRRYFSPANLFDIPKFFWSVLQALFRLYFLMPDAVFSKGGPGAFAVVLAARFYMIPIVIHESDAAPGLTNKLSAKFAKRIGIAFEAAANYFNKNKTFVSGNPIREGLAGGGKKPGSGGKPLIFVWGGSQGSARINRFVFDNLETLLQKYRVFHQVGEKNIYEAGMFSANAGYKFAGFLDLNEMKEALSEADAVIARAGSGSVFEIAVFGKPSILVPLEESANDHQKINAYEYAKTGASIVIEEANLKPSIILSQLENILADKNKYEAMSAAARKFARPDAAKIITGEIFRLLSD